MNSTTSRHTHKSNLTVNTNRVKEFLRKACVETGAWLLSVGFFAGIVWLAGSMF